MRILQVITPSKVAGAERSTTSLCEHLVRAAVPGRVPVTVEDSGRFGWNPDKIIFFDATTGVNLAHKAA